MRLFVVASMYPHPGLPYSGIFIRNCVEALVRQGHEVVVLAPKPYLPAMLSVHPRWAAYAKISGYTNSLGVEVYRPPLIQVPRLAATFQRNQGAFLQTRRLAKRLHRQRPFDAILSFDLSGAGGLAWRLGGDLNIPATGWAFGLDVRVPPQSSAAGELRTMLNRLGLVFYQSTELRQCAQSYLQHGTLDPRRHVVLPHGIPAMSPPEAGKRASMRSQLGIGDDAIVVLFLSRLVKGKGIEELVTSFPIAARENSRLELLVVGETPGFDDSPYLRQRILELQLQDRIRLLPACAPEQVPDYHACADIFAFPSQSEGMPNALLEAMALGTPSVAFDIPPILDIAAHDDCLKIVKSFDAKAMGVAIAQLSDDEACRRELAQRARDVVQTHYDIDTNMAKAVDYLSLLPAHGHGAHDV